MDPIYFTCNRQPTLCVSSDYAIKKFDFNKFFVVKPDKNTKIDQQISITLQINPNKQSILTICDK